LKKSALVQQVLSYLRLKGHKVFRMNSGALPFVGKHKEYRIQLAPPGCPDIIGWQKGTGKFIGVECKVGSNKRTPLQEQFAQSMIDDDCIYILAYDLNDVDAVL
jgi:hypothetical protein